MNNPPAFPNDYAQDESDGMTLRDYFAGKALVSALIPQTPPESVRNWLDNVNYQAKIAYSIADAMLKARDAK